MDAQRPIRRHTPWSVPRGGPTQGRSGSKRHRAGAFANHRRIESAAARKTLLYGQAPAAASGPGQFGFVSARTAPLASSARTAQTPVTQGATTTNRLPWMVARTVAPLLYTASVIAAPVTDTYPLMTLSPPGWPG